MRTRSLVTATAVALALAVAPTVSAEAAPKKPVFTVSASLSTSTADVGQTVRLSGKVSGPRAAKKRLAVQRKVGSGTWKTVARTSTTKSRRYSARVKVTTAGAQQFRVVAPGTKKARQGVSRSRALTGWRWIDPSANGVVQDLTRATLTIDGARHSTWVAPINSSGALFAQIDGRCDALTAGLTVEGGNIDDRAIMQVAQLGSWQTSDVIAEAAKMVLGRSGVVHTRWQIRPATRGIAIFVQTDVAGTARGGLVQPRLHCSVNALPKTPVSVVDSLR